MCFVAESSQLLLKEIKTDAQMTLFLQMLCISCHISLSRPDRSRLYYCRACPFVGLVIKRTKTRHHLIPSSPGNEIRSSRMIVKNETDQTKTRDMKPPERQSERKPRLKERRRPHADRKCQKIYFSWNKKSSEEGSTRRCASVLDLEGMRQENCGKQEWGSHRSSSTKTKEKPVRLALSFSCSQQESRVCSFPFDILMRLQLTWNIMRDTSSCCSSLCNFSCWRHGDTFLWIPYNPCSIFTLTSLVD